VNYIAPRTKVLWHMETLAQIRDGKRPPPINVEVDLSNRCSLGCEWCHFAYTHTRGPLAKSQKLRDRIPGGDLMDHDLALDMLGQLASFGVKSIIWTGGGEPTLHPHFDKVIGYALGMGLQQGIYTHGGHVLSPVRATLLKGALTWINVSLDAATSEEYMRVKRVDGFKRACDGIERLAAAEGEAVLGVCFLITRSNYWRADSMVRLGRNLGADYVYLRPTVLYDMERPGQVGEQTHWLDKAIDTLYAWQDKPDVIVDVERFQMYRDWDGHGYETCWWSGAQTVITPNGKVWTCVNKREHPPALLGDLTEDAFKTIWERHGLAEVDDHCRVMCRGHLANLTLDKVMSEPPHKDFI
jgi:cyclic pyranopterin phosphate synthase